MKNLFLISTLLLITYSAYSQDPCAGEMTYYSIEEGMAHPEEVKNLDIALNKLTVISPDIGKLENLKCLDLSFNRISTLPEEFANLKKLEFLNMTGTRYMSKLPEVLKELPSLKVLDLTDHPEWSAAKKADAVNFLPNVKVIVN